jgi:competence protein ComEA
MIRHIVATLLAVFAFNAMAVEVNKASQAELESVKGIGPALSGKIMAARKTASFKDWTDMQERVSGVGPGNAARLSQAGLTVEGKAFPGSPATGDDKPARKAAAAKS